MKQWKEDYLHTILTMESEKCVFDELIKIAKNIGFDYCAYGLRSPIPMTRQKVIMHNNYPTKWKTQYKENNYISIDPTVYHSVRTPLPIIWSDILFSGAREMWEGAKSHGLCFGLAQSIHDPSGCISMLTLARSNEELSENEIIDIRPKILWLALTAHIGMSSHITSRSMNDTQTYLTEREIEVLRWTADGKTSGEISKILAISERTVNFHINNIVEKLQVSNKLAAAVKAAVLGILY